MLSAVADPAAGNAAPKRQRRRQRSIPRQLRQEAMQHAREMATKYGRFFHRDRTLKHRVVKLMAALLPPRPRRRGRPRDQETTRSILLYKRFRRKYPEERPCETWDRVCREMDPEYAILPDLERKDKREAFRERAKSRARSRRVRKSR